MTISLRRAFAAALLAGALAGPLASCSSTPDASRSSSNVEQPDPTPKSQPDGGVAEMPELEDEVGVFKDADVEACEVGPGPVTANGTVENTAKGSRDLVVSVRWVHPVGNGVIDEDTAVLRQVAAGESASWSASGAVPADTEAQCSFTVLAGSVP